MFFHDALVLTPAPENAPVNLGVQCFNATPHDFWKSGVLGDFLDLVAMVKKVAVGASG